jgi:hypothetical protein
MVMACVDAAMSADDVFQVEAADVQASCGIEGAGLR